jgi:tRNA 2-thiouridine synthesizing protein A
MAQTEIDQTLDARGLLCPMPIVKTSKAMRELEPGQVLRLMATDRGSITDVPAWCESTGNHLVEWHEEEDHIVFLVRKGEDE